ERPACGPERSAVCRFVPGTPGVGPSPPTKRETVRPTARYAPVRQPSRHRRRVRRESAERPRSEDSTMETVYSTHPSPLGELLLVGDGSALSALTLPGQRGRGAAEV